jgi:hypothetical protein
VLVDIAAWRTRPLAALYPIVYFDCLMVVREDRSVSSRACYLAIGTSLDGDREVLGIWWQETEGAKFWLAVLNDLDRRGVEGLAGFPDAIAAVFPRPGCRPASSTRSAARCAESPTTTARRSPPTCGPSTPPSMRRRPPSSSPPLTPNGGSATR